MDEKVRKKMIEVVDKAYDKGYSKESTRIIVTIVCSERAVELGYAPVDGLNLAIKNIEKYQNEKDCINSLIEIIK